MPLLNKRLGESALDFLIKSFEEGPGETYEEIEGQKYLGDLAIRILNDQHFATMQAKRENPLLDVADIGPALYE